MEPFFESTNYRNITQLEKLIEVLTSYGLEYQPVLENIQIPQLQILHDDSINIALQCHQQDSKTDLTIKARQNQFEDARRYSTRVINAMEALAIDPNIIKLAKTIHRKIQGVPAPSTRKARRIRQENTPEDQEYKQKSVSQQSYDSQIEHLGKLAALLSSIPEYTPNENDLKIAAIQSRRENYNNASNQVKKEKALLNRAIEAYHYTLYHPKEGIYKRSRIVRKYIASIYPKNTPRYNEVFRIKFTNRPRIAKKIR